jgi:hypothetical protein
MGFLNRTEMFMNDVEMKAWDNVCDNTPAEEGARFDAVALVVAAGVLYDAAVLMVQRWSRQAGHRVVAVGDDMWTWDFGGPDGYPDALPA